MKLKDLIKTARHIYYAGRCECGERKFDLFCGDGLAYMPIHESTIAKARPELLARIKYYNEEGGNERAKVQSFWAGRGYREHSRKC